MTHATSTGASAPTVFNFNNAEVRTVLKDGEPWFVASDICAALGYSNTSKAVGDHLDNDERAIVLVPRTPNDSLGVATNIINESGLYALVLRSRKPEARKFAKWVTSEVLPAIRKTGSYTAQPAPLFGQRILMRLEAGGRYSTETIPADAYVLTLASFEELLKRTGKSIVPTEAVRALQSIKL